MFCYQCQETAGNQGCRFTKGVCGKPDHLAEMMDLLIFTLKGLSVAAENQKPENNLGLFIAKALFATITNANFDEERIIALINEALDLREELKKTATVDFTADCVNWLPVTIDEMRNKAKNIGVLTTENEDIRSLRELLIYGLKGISAYAEHAAMLGYQDEEIYKFIVKGLAATTKDLSPEQLVGLVLEAGKTAVTTMALLDTANTTTYGNPEISKVYTGVRQNPGILVSGHDLKDFEELLEQTKDKGIDIYTHSEMLPANYYPFFKKYPHLVGNYGSSWWHQNEDFENFNGPILMTTNCIIPVKGTYGQRMFTTGMAGYPEAIHIDDRSEGGKKDFSPLIALAKKCHPPKQLENGYITGGFAHNQVLALADKIVEAVKTGAIKRFVVMAGCDGRHTTRNYFTEVAQELPADTIILTAGCAKYRYNKLELGDIGGIPRVLDAGQCNDSYSLALIALKLKEVFGLADVNQLPLSFDIAWYEQKAVAVLLALLYLGFKNIHLGPTLPGFVSPNVAKVLVDNFNLQQTTDPEKDIALMAAGK